MATADTVSVVRRRLGTTTDLDGAGVGAVRTIDDAGHRLLTVSGILDEMPGVRIRRYGGLGALETVSIRGSSSQQVEVYLDGLPLNSPQWGGANLSEVGVDHLERVEVYRSGIPARFTTAGIGGVVNLVTRPPGATEWRVGAVGGSHGTWKTSITGSGTIAGVEHRLTTYTLRSRGDFDFRNTQSTPRNPDDDTIAPRSNNDLAEHGLLVRLRAPLLGGHVSLRDEWFLREAGNPGRRHIEFENARVENRRHGLAAGIELPRALGDRVATELEAYTLYRRDRYRPGGEIALPRYDSTHRTRTRGLKGIVSVTGPRTVDRITLALDSHRDRFEPVEERDPPREGFRRERRTFTASAGADVALIPSRAWTALGYRYRESEDNFFGPAPFGRPPEARPDPHWSTFHGPSAGARVTLASGVTLRANIAEYVRPPTLFELFGTGDDVAANTELVPEHGSTRDLGCRAEFGGHGWIELTVFRADRDSLIFFRENGVRGIKAENLESARAEGLELSGELRWRDRLRLESTFVTQDVRLHGRRPHWEGRWMPHVSPRELFARISIVFGALVLRTSVDAVDGYYVDPANLPEQRIDGRAIGAIGATWHAPGQVTVSLDVENVTDADYWDTYFRPMPGRSVFLGVQMELPGPFGH